MTELTEAEIGSWPTGVPFRLRPPLLALTLDIVLRTVFGVREGRALDELRDALRDFLELEQPSRARSLR